MLFNALHLYFQNFHVPLIQLVLILCQKVLEDRIVNDKNDSACQVKQDNK